MAMAMTAISAHAREMHVSPSGDDGNAATADAPLRTLHAAQVAARKVAGKEPVTVIIHDGTYYLDNTFVLGPEDSGTAEAPVVYRARNEGKAIISGGMKLDLQWRPYRDGILQSDIPQSAFRNPQSIDQMFVNGERRPMARYPNYDSNARPYNGAAADAFSKERAANWADPAGGYIHAMHRAHWGGYHYRITGKKPDNTVTYEGGWQNNRQMGMHKSHRFVENILEELDAPGEWFHDAKKQTLYYFPPQGEDAATATFEVVRLRHLVELQGSREKPVRHVTLQGLVFRHAARTFMDTKEPLLRSDWTIYRGGAIVIDGAEDCAVADCELDQVGGNGIFVSNYNRRIAVRGTHIHGAGASGVCFVGDPKSVRNPLFEYGQRQNYADIDKTPGPKTDNHPADCTVEDCLIHTVSVVEKQATGVQVSMAQGITIRHCSIYDVGRAGINFSEGTFGGHLIAFCDVFDTVRETGDHGSFNSWGRDRFWNLGGAPKEELPQLALLDAGKTVIRNSRWRCDHGWDVDLDDGSSNYEIYNNLFLHGGLKMREGFHRRAWNNIAVNSGLHPHVWYDNCGDVVTNNVFMKAHRPARMSKSGKWGKEIDRNLFTSEADRVKFAVNGCDGNSTVGDPMFVDPAKGDYSLKEGSPALKMGFENFPMDRFGVQKPSLRSVARTPEFPVPQVGGASPAAPPPTPKARAARYWQGSEVRELKGEEFSAFGVGKDEGGVHVASVPAVSAAADAGLRAGDLVQAIDGKPVKTTADLAKLQRQASGKPLALGIVRGQKAQTIRMESYVHLVAETSANGSFTSVRLAPAPRTVAKIASRPDTANEPLPVLHDGKLAPDYGPVFRNKVSGGMYKVDLGKVVSISSVSTWSYNLNGKRGAQRFTLFASASPNDPGWTVGDGKRFTPIAEVDTRGEAGKTYLATSIERSDGKELGSFRWLVWVTQPVSGVGENTAFQEFQVR
jgi:hypothetical protein